MTYPYLLFFLIHQPIFMKRIIWSQSYTIFILMPLKHSLIKKNLTMAMMRIKKMMTKIANK